MTVITVARVCWVCATAASGGLGASTFIATVNDRYRDVAHGFAIIFVLSVYAAMGAYTVGI